MVRARPGHRRGSACAAALVVVAIAAVLALSSRMRVSTLSHEVSRLQSDLTARQAAESALELAADLAARGALSRAIELPVGAAHVAVSPGPAHTADDVTDTPLRVDVRAGRAHVVLLAHSVRGTTVPARIERVREVAAHLATARDWAQLRAWEAAEETREAGQRSQ